MRYEQFSKFIDLQRTKHANIDDDRNIGPKKMKLSDSLYLRYDDDHCDPDEKNDCHSGDYSIDEEFTSDNCCSNDHFQEYESCEPSLESYADLKKQAKDASISNNHFEEIVLYTQLLDINPYDQHIYLRRSRAYLKLHKFQQALEDIENYIQLTSQSRRGLIMKGKILTEFGKSKYISHNPL